MGKYKAHPKYNIISIRISDKEKAVFEEMKRHSQKNISMIMREALQHYASCFDLAIN